MAEIKIERNFDKEKLKQMGVFNWPIWQKEPSRFDWHYSAQEQCYLLEGKAEVETEDGKSVTFTAGDFVVFPKGLSCVWNISQAVKKHYQLD